MTYKCAVCVFPGSNCDRDLLDGVNRTMGLEGEFVFWHSVPQDGYDCYLLAGGFSYGDYLRPGALSAVSELMDHVRLKADEGKPIIGICNGFQILVEAGLLPGALMINSGLHFTCDVSPLIVENNTSAVTRDYTPGEVVRYPIAHMEGNYFNHAEDLEKLERSGQVLFRYGKNPNGSANDIAGISNEAGNVVGLMPHPERAMREGDPSFDGIPFFRSICKHLENK